MTELKHSIGTQSRESVQAGAVLRLKKVTEGFGSLIAVIVACAIFATIDPVNFASVANLKTLLDQSAVPLIIVSGLTFVILMGSVDLSIEGVMAASSLVFVLVSANSRNGIDLGLASPVVALIVGMAFGATSGLLQTFLRIPSFMVSLGIWFIGLGVATVLYGSDVPMLNNPVLRGWASDTTMGISNAVLVAAASVLVSFVISTQTKFGRYAYAIGSNETVSRLNSIPVDRYKILVFAYCGLFVSVAAVIGSSRLGVGTPDVGTGQLFLCTAAVIIGGTPLSGGRGGILQSACGVLLLVIVSNGLILVGASPITQQALSGLIIVVAVVMTGLRHRAKLRVVK
jgi:ribose transport system permease protein